MTTTRPNSARFRQLLGRIGVLWLWACLPLSCLWGGRILAQGETPEIIRQQDEEEARRKVLRASDTIDQIEGTVEGHSRELQRLQQELSQMKEELRRLREGLSQSSPQSSASAPQAEGTKAEGKTAHVDSGPSTLTAADSDRHTKVVTGYYYKVQAGDTLAAIAEAYRQSGVPVTADQIRAANGISRRKNLRPGQKIFIPKGSAKKTSTSSEGSTAPPPRNR
ncbi:MAG: LysM peptidoglycan-binding domain-containing protein [Candidatus Methylacidiphilaceae bacterium]